jgi:hypothetical protein
MTTPGGVCRYGGPEENHMKRTVLVFGLLSGAVASGMMLLTIPFMDRIGFDRAEVLGYVTIVAAFLLVFFGVRSYRAQVGGTLSFGRAFRVGILITLVSCACYVVTWQFIYYRLAPGFVDQYAVYVIDRVRASGANQQEIDDTERRMGEFKTLYANPFVNVGLTFLEPFPIGLVVTLISAAALRRTP